MMSLRKRCIAIAAALTFILYSVVITQSRTEPNALGSEVEFVISSTEKSRNLTHVELWFLKKVFRTLDLRDLAILPGEDPSSDRILNQLMFVPENYDPNIPVSEYKTIYMGNTDGWYFKENLGSSYFKSCQVKTCNVVKDSISADLIFTRFENFTRRHPDQLVLFYEMESPLRYHKFKQNASTKGDVDLTSTYRLDSDIVAPYGKFFYYNENVRQKNQTKNLASGKSKKVAVFISNCFDARNKRLEIVESLKKYIEVDVFGKCGTKECPKDDKGCMRVLQREYKFYLAFENSNCQDYVTEKFFINSLTYNVLPIVMGANRKEVERVAPEHSFIHVDDFKSVRELGEYLNLLDSNDELYNSYFRWHDTGELIPYGKANYWCRVCAVLHSPNIKDRTKFSLYGRNFSDWWKGEGVCRPDTIEIN